MVAVCELASGALQAVVGACPEGSTTFYGAGINLFDVFWCASTGMHVQKLCSFNESLSMLQSYKATGLRFFRFFATDWGPNKIFWYRNPEQNWKELDRVWDAIDASGLYAIPSIRAGSWDEVADQVVPGLHEGPNDLVCNSTSVSRGIANMYFTQFVRRYHGRRSLLMWELGNELNLMPNLPPPHCSESDHCFNTTAMVRFTKEMVALIRDIDPVSRPISSGFSTPRPFAWHMEHCPPNSSAPGQCAADPSSRGFWATDSAAQFRENLRAQQAAVDVWSIHLYVSTAAHVITRRG